MRRPPVYSRSGVAVVEFAVLLPLLLLLLCGLWVVGNMIQIHHTLDWAAREGARIASQGQIINLAGNYQQITVTTSDPSIKSTVEDYLEANGITVTGLVVEYANLTTPASAQPWQAKKGEQISVTVKLPHDNVRLPVITKLPSWALPDPDFLTSYILFTSMQDDPFTIDDTMPTWNPL